MTLVTAPAFRVDLARHLYFLGDEQLPGNTTVLKAAGHIDTTFYTDDGKAVGSALHLACRYYDEGRLDERTLETPPGADERTAKLKAKVRARFRAYVRFRSETGFIPDLIEFATYSLALKVAGTLDRTGNFPHDKWLTLLDIKGGAPAKWHGYQTGGYALMGAGGSYGEWGRLVQRAALYLRDDCTYRLKFHRDPEDLNVFTRAALDFHKPKEA